MLMGTYRHAIDAKGRIIVPSKFREEFGSEFVVTKGLDGCLFVYAPQEWQRIIDNLHDRPMTSRDARKFMRFFVGSALSCEVDKQGRASLPQNLREYAAIEKDVVSVGLGSRVEIWSAQRYEDNGDYDNMDEIAEHMAEMGILI